MTIWPCSFCGDVPSTSETFRVGCCGVEVAAFVGPGARGARTSTGVYRRWNKIQRAIIHRDSFLMMRRVERSREPFAGEGTAS